MRKGEATRLAILDEASRLASQVGLSGLTIGSLATQTELSKSGLFAHFHSKESLQIQVLAHAETRFREEVVMPVLAARRGEPRLRELFERWRAWVGESQPGGCLFIAAGNEFDDQPGLVRDQVERAQRDLFDAIERVVATAVDEGHLSAETEPAQFAQDFYGVMLAYHLASRLLRNPEAEQRARRGFENLLRAAR